MMTSSPGPTPKASSARCSPAVAELSASAWRRPIRAAKAASKAWARRPAPRWAGTLRRLAAESVLYGLAGAIGRAAALVTVPILSRTLAPADYGLADLATALAALVQLVVSFSGDIPAARLRALAPDSAARRAVIA